MIFSIGLTHRCNLGCAYCYAGRSSKPDMSLTTAKMAVDFAFDISPLGQKIEFGFFGGEALIRFDLMQDICNYIELKARQDHQPIRLSLTTNGTLLNTTMLDFFKAQNIELCISLDGPAHVHDLYRPYLNGRGSMADVVRSLHLALKHEICLQVNAVYGPETIDHLPESLVFLVEQGARSIHFSPNVYSRWDPDAFIKLRTAFMAVADQYCDFFRSGRDIAINFIDSKIILFIKGGYSVSDRCGMGKTQWAFAPSGNIYPCERLIGDDDDPSLILGNVHTGLNPVRCVHLRKRCGNRNEECQSCDLKRYCMNWCGCTNYFMTGYTDLTGPSLCAMERAAMQAAKYVMNTLVEEDNDRFIDHFMHYLVQEETNSSQKGVVDTWQKEVNGFDFKQPSSSKER